MQFILYPPWNVSFMKIVVFVLFSTSNLSAWYVGAK